MSEPIPQPPTHAASPAQNTDWAGPIDSRVSTPSLDQIALTNPSVDASRVRNVLALVERLRRYGLAPKRYAISHPFERRSTVESDLPTSSDTQPAADS